MHQHLYVARKIIELNFLLKSFSIRSMGKLRPQSYYSGHISSNQNSKAIRQGHEYMGTLALNIVRIGCLLVGIIVCAQ